MRKKKKQKIKNSLPKNTIIKKRLLRLLNTTLENTEVMTERFSLLFNIRSVKSESVEFACTICRTKINDNNFEICKECITPFHRNCITQESHHCKKRSKL